MNAKKNIFLLVLLIIVSGSFDHLLAKTQKDSPLPSYSLIEATVNTKTRFNGHFLVKQELDAQQLRILAQHFQKKYRKRKIVVLKLWDDSAAYQEYKLMMDPQRSNVGEDDYWTKYDQVTRHLLVSYEKNANTGEESLVILGKEGRLSSK